MKPLRISSKFPGAPQSAFSGKLHKNGAFLKSSVEDQLKLFKNSWPKSEAASGYEDFYWWFFDPECPAGIAWRKEDGSYEIVE